MSSPSRLQAHIQYKLCCQVSAGWRGNGLHTGLFLAAQLESTLKQSKPFISSYYSCMIVCPHQQKNPAALEEKRGQLVASCFNKHEIQTRMHQLWTTQTTEKWNCYPEAHWSKSGMLTGTWASSFSQIARDHWGVCNNCCSPHKNHASMPTLCFFSLLLSVAVYSFLFYFGFVLNCILCTKQNFQSTLNPARCFFLVESWKKISKNRNINKRMAATGRK